MSEVTIILKKEAIVKINGIPLKLAADTLASTNASNVPLIFENGGKCQSGISNEQSNTGIPTYSVDIPGKLPQYKCHKVVGALKIKAVHELPPPDGTTIGKPSYGAVITPEDERYTPFEVSPSYMRMNPQAGGYFVQYADGYCSYSPAGAFEEGYSLIDDDLLPIPEVEEISHDGCSDAINSRTSPQASVVSADIADALPGSVEQEIISKGLVAPRVTPDDINNNIIHEHYFTATDGVAG